MNEMKSISNKNISGYKILDDGTLNTDVSENFRRGKKLSLNDPSLLVSPIDTNYVVNVKLEDDSKINEESTIGSLTRIIH